MFGEVLRRTHGALRTGETKTANEINRRFRPQFHQAGKRNVEKCGDLDHQKQFNINGL
jgi:hypothetical protein